MQYQVIKGIFEGRIFNGTVKNNRVYNNDTTGQSYPLKNCIELKNNLDLCINDVVKIVKPFPNADLTGKTAKVVEISQFRQPVFYIEVEGKKITCLPEYVEKL